MIRKLVGAILLFFICCPLTATAYTKSGIFLHQYKYELEDVLDANKFVEKKGYWEGYKDNQLVGYVFLSTDWTKNILGYAGQHMETLIGMDPKGVITDVKLISHAEPIVLIGLKESAYHKFLKQYRGKDIRQDLTIGEKITIDAITGATVTAVVHNAIILRSARRVAIQTGIIEPAKGPKRKLSDKVIALTWQELLQAAAIKNLMISSKELGIEGEDVYLDLYFGLATTPSIGRSILGDKPYEDTIGRLKPGESVIFIFANGKGSFKGSGFARGGVFDRFSLEQQEEVYFFKEADYRNFSDIEAKGAPRIQEGGLFIVRSKDFDPAGPFIFSLVLPYHVGGKKEFKSFNVNYQTPDMFLE